jgi:hypothetical protein
MNILISHCNTENASLFGLSYCELSSGQVHWVDLSQCDLMGENDVGLTGICQNSEHIYVGTQSVSGAKILVFNKKLVFLQTINLSLVEDLHSIEIQDNKIYCTSTRNNRITNYDLSTHTEEIIWEWPSYIHLNDVKFYAGQWYILSQDSLSEKNTGGTITRLGDMSTIITGLDQPHTICFEDNYVYVLSSKAGDIRKVNLETDESITLTNINGYIRGMVVDKGRLIIGSSAERLHSRKQGKDKIFVSDFNDYLGNTKYQSGLYEIDSKTGSVLSHINITSINFEIYELLNLKISPAKDRLITDAAAIKAQYYRQQLHMVRQHEQHEQHEQSLTTHPEQHTSSKPFEKMTPKVILRKSKTLFSMIGNGEASQLIKPTPLFYKGIYYFSDAWPLNFWNNYHPKRVTKELKNYKKLGINTVFILIPWAGFIKDPQVTTLDPQYLKSLKHLFKLCKRLNLNIVSRLGYNHCICDDSILEPYQRTEKLLTDTSIYNCWLSFIDSLSFLEKYSRTNLFFISWEDYWHCFTSFQDKSYEQRLELAKEIGFQNFISKAYSLEEYNSIQKEHEATLTTFDNIVIPTKDNPSHILYLEFINHKIRTIYDDCSQKIDSLTVEVRVDKDLYSDKEGNSHWFTNDRYEDINRPILTYWAPFFGAKNEGEKVSAAQALVSLKYLLTEFSPNEHILNQFNFIDSTPEFEGIHAAIKDDEIEIFLAESQAMIREHCRGFGIWAMRDYHQNILFNANFSLENKGWDIEQGEIKSSILSRSPPACILSDEGVLSQQMIPRKRGMGWIHHAKYLNLSIACNSATGAGQLSAFLEDLEPVRLISNDTGCSGKLALPTNHRAKTPLKLTIINNGSPLKISRVSLYGYTFTNNIIRADGSKDKLLNIISSLFNYKRS